MKIKHLLIFLVIIILTLGGYAWFLYTQIKKLKLRVLGVKLSKPINVQELNILSALQTLNLELDVQAQLQNYSARNFKINNFNIEVFDKESGQLLAKQTQPITNIVVEAGKTEDLKIPIVIKVIQLSQALFKNADLATLASMLTLLNIGQGKLNKTLIVKGFVRVQNIPFAYPINEEVEI